MERIVRYNQLGLGDCGHVVVTWPQFSDFSGRRLQVFCDECLREKYALDPSVQFILVNLVEKTAAPKPKPRPKPKPKPKKANAMALMLERAGFFDGP